MSSTSSSGAASIYSGLRASVDDAANESSLSRVEVNQRALIDKILARYASAGAVYRELLQNSNDAEATQAEIYFVTTTTNSSKDIVQEVTYRNNGMPFRPQDWDRLRKIAEGNPNPSKVGAFGVGAYTMFSICEEPIVMSGTQALAFIWKGDALWTKTTTLPKEQQTQWTSFVLPSRDAYPLPDLTEFGEFLAASLTFTKCLKHVQVFVNGKERLSILKTLVEAPRLVKAPQLKDSSSNSNASSSSSSMFWWATPSLTSSSSSSLVKTASPRGTFYLDNTKTGTSGSSSGSAFPIYETIYRIFVALDEDTAYIDARYVSAVCKTKIPADMAKRMERVTKKQPPKEVTVEIFLNAAQQEDQDGDEDDSKKTKKISPARRITQSFVPQQGAGRIFIGFRTSQTTGLAAHVAAPFCPTVEREAMDLQDAALCVYNTELLHMAGILLRLTLHHAFSLLHVDWINNAPQRAAQLKREVQAEAMKKRNKGLLGQGTSTTTKTNGETDGNGEDENDDDDDATTTTSGGSSLMGFARFMARGVKKKIVSVVSTVEQLLDDGGTGDYELLHPLDLPRSLATEERHAILLMQSYCPRQSTPDAAVGTALAQGFSNCMPNSSTTSSSNSSNTPSMSPPVLTKSGVLAGDEARLPHHGIEAFVQDKVIRSVVYENAKEYHDVIACTRKLSLRDLGRYLENTVLTQEQAIRLVQWWRPYSRLIDAYMAERQGVAIKELVRFYPDNGQGATTTTLATTTSGNDTTSQQQKASIALKDLLFYIPKDSLLYTKQQELPLPETVLPLFLQQAIGLPTLADNALLNWFSPLPMELWAEFVSHAPCMVQARPEDEQLRIQVWAVLHKEFQSRSYDDRQVFASFCQSLFAQKRCLPFDSQEPVSFAAERPSDLYLYSAELKAFEGASSTTSFRKVSTSLKQAGVGEDFLLCLGVRRSVAVDFLFAHLDTLKWSTDPQPLIEYLRTATLTREDLHKLSQTKYLPAEKDESKASYAPSELYLPTVDLRIFPFLKILLWPSETEVSEKSENGRFLIRLGVQGLPSLQRVLEYVANEIPVADKKEPEGDVATQAHRRQCLDFLAERLGPKGVYHQEYTRMRYSIKNSYRILPCVTQTPLLVIDNSDTRQTQLMSPVMAYSEESCGIMGFPVIDPKLGESGKLYGSLFQCATQPDTAAVLNQLKYLVSRAQAQQRNVASPEAAAALLKSIETAFTAIFKYLSHRSSDFARSELQLLANESFIPCRSKETDKLAWFRPSQVFFRHEGSSADSLTEELFQVIEFSPFLAAAGVKQEASTKELFQLLLHSPKSVMQTLGSEKKYRALLRRIAANRPFSRVTDEIRKAPFLLAYTIKTSEAKEGTTPAIDATTYDLAAAEDIYIIDNSFFGRMFPVKRAPHESDLEDFYALIGCQYISKSVERRFEVIGRPIKDTELTQQLRARIVERAPLLVSPHVTTRPLVPNAPSILDEKSLDFLQASNLMAVFSLRGVSRRNRTTCFSRKIRGQNVIYMVEDFDWFDVGYAIGDLILQRCQLEDAFFISSLLDAPLEQLRARGFPVERILLPKPAPEPPTPPPPSPPEYPTPQTTPASVGTGTIAKIPEAPIAAAASSAGDAGTRAQIPDTPISAGTPDAQKPASSSSNGDAKPPVSTNDNDTASTKPPTADDSKAPASANDSGFADIIQQMFPHADAEFIRGALGPNPDLNDVRNLAESMATGSYPKSDAASDAGTLATAGSSNSAAATSQPSSPTDSVQKKTKGGLRKKFGRALGGLGGLRGSSSQKPPPIEIPRGPMGGGSMPEGLESGGGGSQKPAIDIRKGPMGGGTMPQGLGNGSGNGGDGVSAGPSSNTRHETQGPVSPGTDEQSQTNLGHLLERAVGSSSTIDGRGVHSQEHVVTSVPADLDRGETCEVVESQSLKPFPGQTSNGIRIFSSRKDASSEAFLAQNPDVVEAFAVVLQRLSVVYGHRLASIAIYYDPTGRTIAFNSGGGALHFNLRFFHALHFLTNKSNSRECYSYWYVTMAHELAHNMVSAHNKEHGFYTESFASHFLPKLIELLGTL